MSCLIYYEESSCSYIAKSLKEPLAIGEGVTLYSALDDLEQKIQKLGVGKGRQISITISSKNER